MPQEIAATWSLQHASRVTMSRAAIHCEAVVQRHPGAGDRGRARAAIGLDHVAIDGDLPLAERGEVDHGAQRAADQALDLLRAAATACRPHASRRVRSWVARGSMPYSAVTQPLPPPRSQGGTRLLEARGAQHMGVAELHQAGALGMARDAALEARPARISSGARLEGAWSSWNGRDAGRTRGFAGRSLSAGRDAERKAPLDLAAERLHLWQTSEVSERVDQPGVASRQCGDRCRDELPVSAALQTSTSARARSSGSIVETYLGTGEPVGSRNICAHAAVVALAGDRSATSWPTSRGSA